MAKMDLHHSNIGSAEHQSAQVNRGKLQKKAVRKIQSTSYLFGTAFPAPPGYQPPVPPLFPEVLSDEPEIPPVRTTAQNRLNLRRFKSHYSMRQQSKDAAESYSQGPAPGSYSQVKIPRGSSKAHSPTSYTTMTSSLDSHKDLVWPSMDQAFLSKGEVSPSKDQGYDHAQEQSTNEISIDKGKGKALFQAAEQTIDASSDKGKGRASTQVAERPLTQDSTLVASTRPSHLSSMTAVESQHDAPRFGTITTISGPSGPLPVPPRAPREGPIKRLMKMFQRNHLNDDDPDADSDADSHLDPVTGLDPFMTCRGLPGIHYFEEVEVTSEPADPGPASDPRAEPDVISHFAVSKHYMPNTDSSDANDESLQRYKQSLGLGGGKDLSDPNDPRVCIIHALTMESPGRDPVTIDLSQPGSEVTLKDKPFKIKEGSKFTMVVTFKVQHEILSGLQYVQVVKRKGLKVGKDSEMLGSYAPNTDKQPLYVKRFQEEDAPAGMLARGHYNAVSSFVDDDKKTHLQFEWSFDISKDW
ncbi:rho GDP dissociation inhibitor [Diatrype stigma]|uniref:Rho GDP-dissociation inhibitor n=1 Tax=Diatrype stigma TaxID=117547 RepID=A0AAN9UIC5_9PEZI